MTAKLGKSRSPRPGRRCLVRVDEAGGSADAGEVLVHQLSTARAHEAEGYKIEFEAHAVHKTPFCLRRCPSTRSARELPPPSAPASLSPGFLSPSSP